MAVLLVVPFALFLIVRRLLGRRSTMGVRGPLAFVGLALAVGIAVSLETIKGPVVREEVVHVKDCPMGWTARELPMSATFISAASSCPRISPARWTSSTSARWTCQSS